jgi:hypothetical protein
MVLIYLLIFVILLKLLYIYFKNKYSDKKNVIIIDSKKEYDKIQKTIDESISKLDNKNKLKQYIDTIV